MNRGMNHGNSGNGPFQGDPRSQRPRTYPTGTGPAPKLSDVDCGPAPFNVGDVVQLKSGGPLMTVYSCQPAMLENISPVTGQPTLTPIKDVWGVSVVWCAEDGTPHQVGTDSQCMRLVTRNLSPEQIKEMEQKRIDSLIHGKWNQPNETKPKFSPEEEACMSGGGTVEVKEDGTRILHPHTPTPPLETNA